jgi:hypothetical protein
VMWLPRENRWTVIDFGCVARTGEPARLGFSVAYAAPEVISAYRRSEQTMSVQVCRFVLVDNLIEAETGTDVCVIVSQVHIMGCFPRFLKHSLTAMCTS